MARDTSKRADINRHAVAGLVVVAILVPGIGGWSMTTNISGAVVAGGTVVVESNAKRVQHPDGGIVAKIYVHNDDRVTAGDPLLTLDDTALKASLRSITGQLDEALAAAARLTAEISDADDFAVPADMAGEASDPSIAALISTQKEILKSHKAVREGKIVQYEQQIAQLESQIEGNQAKATALRLQLDVVNKERADLSGLLEAKLVQATRVNELKKQTAQIEGDLGATTSAISQARAAIAERRVMIRQVAADALDQALNDMQSVREKIGQLTQQKIAAEAKLARVDIVSPQTGIVHESAVQTVGGVVGAGETLMMIVPTDDELVVEMRLNPVDIDKVHVGQDVIVRILGFNRRSTPDLSAMITQIAPDLTTDQKTGVRYYVVRARFDADKLRELPPELRLVPGMPTEAYIQTGARSVMTYILQPLVDQFSKAMRES